MTKTNTAAELRLRRATLRALDAMYVMFFGEGDRWSIWAVVMAVLCAMFLGIVTDGFAVPPSLGQIIFLAAFVAISAVGVYFRRKRKNEQ